MSSKNSDDNKKSPSSNKNKNNNKKPEHRSDSSNGSIIPLLHKMLPFLPEKSTEEEAILIGAIAGASFLLLLVLICMCCCCFCCCKRRKKNLKIINAKQQIPNQQQHGSDIHLKMPPHGNGSTSFQPPTSETSSTGSYQNSLPPPYPGLAMGFNKSIFTYDELATATRGFDRSLILGQGGFGYVYKGVLPNGKEVAVKSLKAGGGQGEREFQAEVEIISRVHHRHLVSLVGYCIADEKRMLVYEFIPNRTLEYHLQRKGRVVLDSSTRLKIALGSAKGFAYLHEDCTPRIIHRDIKAANILIDNQYEAKVADFGLAKLSDDTHVSTRIMGTFGYLAPEYASTGKLTEKSDVFSFGVVLLELITGRRAVDMHSDEDDSLIDWAAPILIQASNGGSFDEMVDPRLEGKYDKDEMHRMVACATACLRHVAKRRPKMSQIVRVLEGDVSLDDFYKADKKANATPNSNDKTSNKRIHNKSGSMSSQEFSSGEYGL